MVSCPRSDILLLLLLLLLLLFTISIVSVIVNISIIIRVSYYQYYYFLLFFLSLLLLFLLLAKLVIKLLCLSYTVIMHGCKRWMNVLPCDESGRAGGTSGWGQGGWRAELGTGEGRVQWREFWLRGVDGLIYFVTVLDPLILVVVADISAPSST